MYFKNFFHKYSKISIFLDETNSPWQGYWFLKAFQNAELPEYAVPCRRCLSEDVDIF